VVNGEERSGINRVDEQGDATSSFAAENPDAAQDRGAAEEAAAGSESVAAADVARLRKEVTDLTERVEELQAKADEWLDKYRRSVAEFSNYRKRQERERQQQAWRINADVMRRLLEPLDDLERALSNVPEDCMDSGWVQGVELIAQKIRNVLSEYNVEPIAAVGQPFDPLYHDALIQEPHDEYPEGIVVEELETGYLMDGQVLRPARVKVSSGPEGADDDRGQ